MSNVPSTIEIGSGLTQAQRLKQLQMILDVSRQVASMDTLDAVLDTLVSVVARRDPFAEGRSFRVGDIAIRSRKLPHDAPQVALRFETKDTALGLVTDLGGPGGRRAEAVVIGAGPAGLAVAWSAARRVSSRRITA